jgi:hypothetical protein
MLRKYLYSEEYLGGNLLLDVSMSLSPLFAVLTSVLQVNTAGDPPPEFLPASVNPGIVHHLSGLILYALTPIPPRGA